VASFFCIDIPIKDAARAVIIIAPNRMAVAGVFGIAKASIRNTGTSPIAIIFICISLIFIVNFLPHLFPVKNNSSFVAEPHVRFESVVVIRSTVEIKVFIICSPIEDS
jgi:hypothetical protein